MSLFDSASIVVTPNAYKASKLYAIKPTDGSGDLTVVRATTARRVNSAGLIESVANNVPRLDYTNSTCPSILVEPQRTNVTQQSEDFSNGYWVKTNSDINSNSVIAPDNVLSADTFSDRVLTSQTYVLSRNQSYTSGTAYTSSFFAKNLNRRYVYMRFVSSVFGTNKYVFFDLQLGTIISVSSGVTAEIIDYGNGWFRCIATSTASVTTTTTNGVFIGLSDNGVNVSYTNPSVKSIYIWGAQLEAGSNATSYIPTTSASVTRNADIISKTGISSLIGQTEGTMFVDYLYNENFENFSTNDNVLLGCNDNTSNSNMMRIIHFGNSISTPSISKRIRFVARTSNVNVAIITSLPQISGRYKVVATYKNNEFKLFVNGVLIGTDTSGGVPTTNNLFLYDFINTGTLQNYINTAALWKTALTDQECINLTTI